MTITEGWETAVVPSWGRGRQLEIITKKLRKIQIHQYGQTKSYYRGCLGILSLNLASVMGFCPFLSKLMAVCCRYSVKRPNFGYYNAVRFSRIYCLLFLQSVTFCISFCYPAVVFPHLHKSVTRDLYFMLENIFKLFIMWPTIYITSKKVLMKRQSSLSLLIANLHGQENGNQSEGSMNRSIEQVCGLSIDIYYGLQKVL